MSRNQEPVTVPYDGWVELTNGDAAEITFQVVAGRVEIKLADTEPDLEERGFVYAAREGERKIPVEDISVGGGGRLWAKGVGYPVSTVMVDHA